jgi:hypothetical protein
LVVVLGFISLDDLADLIEDINVVDDEGLADIVEERKRALEGLDQLEEILELFFTTLAILNCVGDNLSSLTKELNTSLDTSGVLGFDVFNTIGNVRDDSFRVSNACSDFIEEGS